MPRIRLIVWLALFVVLAAAQPMRAQDQGAAAQPVPAVTPAQAQQALDILQDDDKRARLLQTLQTIAKATPSAAASNAPSAGALARDNLSVQLLAQVSDWFGDISSQLAMAARSVSDFPTIWRWLVQLTTDPMARRTLLDTAWKLALVIACAFAAEWLTRRGLRRPLRAVDGYVPARARPSVDVRPAIASATESPAETHELRRWHATLAHAWQLALRLPFVLARLVLELLPVICFAAVGNVLLATDIGGQTTPRVVILAIVNAYVLCRGILCITAAVVSPSSSQPSLLVIADETAAYVDVWWRRIVLLTVFGIALANIALLLGLNHSAYLAAVRLLMLLVHLFVVVVILQCRRSVADFIRSRWVARGTLAAIRDRFADIWHILAIVLDLALWVVWALQVQNGYALLLRYFLTTIALLAIARLASIAILAALDRMFRIRPEFLRQFPGLEARANRYLPALRAAVSGLVVIITVIALLEIWGIDATAWFASGHVGGRLVSALIPIAIAGLIALAAWEAVNAAIDQHLMRLSREGRYARAARLRTFLPMLRTTLLSIIATVVALTALSELGVDIAPLLAGAGIVGIAIGFGSQKLVQDVITGLFLLLENAMQVGDTVTVSGLTGVVENLSIRTIRLRAGDGSIHIVPFSSVTSVTNTNRGIGNAAISVDVAYNEDTDRVGAVLKEIAAKMREEPEFKRMIRGHFDLWGVDRVNASMATVVGQIECTDTGRWPVQREFYRRMKKRFQELNIEIARPAQTTVVLQNLPIHNTEGPAQAADESRRRSTG
jgi:small-conductance mechanosensitive channel